MPGIDSLTLGSQHIAVEAVRIGVFAENHGGSVDEVAQQGDHRHGLCSKGSVCSAMWANAQSAALEPGLHRRDLIVRDQVGCFRTEVEASCQRNDLGVI